MKFALAVFFTVNLLAYAQTRQRQTTLTEPKTVRMGTCGGKEATAFIPQKFLAAMRKAEIAGDDDEVVRIARRAGLTVLSSRKNGHVASYLIMNHAGHCVAMRGPTIKN
jgi:hypothetical protein